MIRYPTRNDALHAPVTWVLDGAELRLEDDEGPPQIVPLASIRQVRLEYAPSRPEPNRFRCRLSQRNGRALFCYNRTYEGFANFKDTSAEYVALMHALHAGLRTHAPDCSYEAGQDRWRYRLNLAIIGACVLLLVAIMPLLWEIGLTWLIVLKLLLIVFYVPTLISSQRRNRPRSYPPDAIPSDVLPS